MKALKISKVLLFSVLFLAASCKKDKAEIENKYSYLGADTKIGAASATHRIITTGTKPAFDRLNILFDGGGTERQLTINFNAKSVLTGRFTNKDDDSPDFNPAVNFDDGVVRQDGASDRITDGTVEISKSGDTYTVKVTVITAKGPLTCNYVGAIPLKEG
jgi:hypothetical protein